MRLPYDLAVLVAKNLSVKDVFQCSLVSKSWHSLFTSDNVLFPFVQQLTHFDQEPLMLRCLPMGHDHHSNGDDEEEALSKGGDDATDADKDPKAKAEEERLKIEDLANQQWMKSSRVLVRSLGKSLNRERRWRRAEPTTRLYLPPVPIDGSDSDILEEWQGAAKSIKMKGGIVAVLFEKGSSIRIWNLDAEYDEIRDMTNKYIDDNMDLLKAQTKYGGPALPPYETQQVDALLRCARSGAARSAQLKVVKLRIAPTHFDFFLTASTLVTAAKNGEVDVYDMQSGQHRRTFKVEGNLHIGSLHVWMDYVVVGHGSHISLWNHKTGETLESELRTSHRANINGVFILDNDKHLMSIDESGIMVVTNRAAKRPEIETLLDVPLYPMIMVGQMGAPYAMRLLHMSHLCVWGKYSLGHYELYEPGLRHLPPLSSLLVNADGRIVDEEGQHSEDDAAVSVGIAALPAAASRAGTGRYTVLTEEERRLEDSKQTLAQLEATHDDLEKMYSEIAGDRSSEHPEGERMVRRRMNHVPAEDQYHIINIDPPVDLNPGGLVLSVDFRHAVYLHRNYVTVHEIDKIARKDESPHDELDNDIVEDGLDMDVCSVGLNPIDRQSQSFGPARPQASFRHDSALSLRQVIEQKEAKRAEAKRAKAGDTIDESLAGDLGSQTSDGDSNYETVSEGDDPADDEDLAEDMDGEQTEDNIETMMRNLHMDMWYKEIKYLVCKAEKASLRRVEAAMIRFTMGLSIERDEPAFGEPAAHAESLWFARKFLEEYVPELLAEIDVASLDINMLLSTVSFYAQRLHESKFRTPVLNVDHRGQVTTAAQLHRDMERVYRAARVPAARMPWSSNSDFVSKAACFLRYRAAAMDDGRVAVACENGYVVVMSFD
ncbi:hypothetical protein GGF42_003213 [Coemansia sp. RSA 2424]|nr:hypothetical protein GGF42_003213 [Coemansia sp. RSA 2424]